MKFRSEFVCRISCIRFQNKFGFEYDPLCQSFQQSDAALTKFSFRTFENGKIQAQENISGKKKCFVKR